MVGRRTGFLVMVARARNDNRDSATVRQNPGAVHPLSRCDHPGPVPTSPVEALVSIRGRKHTTSTHRAAFLNARGVVRAEPLLLGPVGLDQAVLEARNEYS